MKQAVIDASVIAKWMVDEDHSDRAIQLLALAEKLAVSLVTADQRLIRKIAGDATLSKLMVWVGDYAR